MVVKLVILESPYAGDVERNLRYLDACILDCVRRGESPYASHRMLTSALKDSVPADRAKGIDAGFAWRPAAAKTVVYTDLGISGGMRFGIDHAKRLEQLIEYRRLGGEWAT